MTKIISVAALIAGMATSSYAGSLGAVDTKPVDNGVFVPAGSSAGGIAVPLAIGGGLLALALIAGDDDDEAAATTTSTEDAD